jgi:hypothetical protein
MDKFSGERSKIRTNWSESVSYGRVRDSLK